MRELNIKISTIFNNLISFCVYIVFVWENIKYTEALEKERKKNLLIKVV